jgi:hypothetical protein
MMMSSDISTRCNSYRRPTGHGIIDIRNAYGKREDLDFDLKQYVHLTDEGRAYLSLLEELMRLTPAT